MIGAGPGDPRLITVGGKEALECADVVVYDRLAHPVLLNYAPASAERVYVGKQADRHAMKQENINELLAERASRGLRVARLKGGDPFVFGRGGEEAEYLRERGIRWVLIPGVTSAIAAPAYAGIPVTHRDAASSFAVITGHERDDRRESGTRVAGQSEGRRQWDKIANAADTLLFLMGVENLTEIVSELQKHGRSPATPVALVRWGTWAGQQETLVSTLEHVVDDVQNAQFKAPAVTIVGEVVGLRERLRWFDLGPLSGKRIVVTRAREQASAFAAKLRDRNAEPIEFPLIRASEPEDNYAALDREILATPVPSWLLFLSISSVDAFFARLDCLGKDARHLSSSRIGCVGSATAKSLAKYGVRADFVSRGTTGNALGEELPGDLIDQRVLIPRAAIGDEGILSILKERGAHVTAPTAYCTVVDGENVDEIRARLADGTIDVLTFTSSSTVRNFVTALGTADLPENICVACIGPSTAETARTVLGREPEIVAEDHTVEGLLVALEKYFAAKDFADVPELRN